MQVAPAHINQVLASSGRYHEVTADVGMVADELRRIDPTLKVRFQPDCPEPYFAVFCQPTDRETYLVLTVEAHQNSFGVWEGLDKRVVREFERIGADGYDYPAELAKRNERARSAQQAEIRERLEAAGHDGWELLNRLRGRNCAHMAVP